MKTKSAARKESGSTHELTIQNWAAESEERQVSQLPAVRFGSILNANNAPAAAGANVGGERDASAKIPMANFLEILRDAVVPHDSPPTVNFIVNSAKYIGSSKKDCMDLKCVFSVQLISKRWTTVRLLPATVACRSSSVTVVSPQGEDGHEAKAVVCVRQNAYCLIAEQPNIYRVELDVASPFLSEHIRGIRINVPEAVTNELEFFVPEANTVVTSDPCTTEAQEDVTNGVIYRSCFQPTTTLTVHVSRKLEEEGVEEEIEEAAATKEEEIVTVEQFSLFGVGEGVVRGSTRYEYSMTHGSRSVFEIALPDGIRVMQVQGASIKRWDVISAIRLAAVAAAGVSESPFSIAASEDSGFNFVERSNTNTEISSNAAAALGAGPPSFSNSFIPLGISINQIQHHTPGRVLKVWLDFATDATYALTVDFELDMASTSAQVELPRFICRNVNRDKGYIAVEARTNVEIAEKRAAGTVRLDSSELPTTLTSMAKHPILHAYKFLSSNNVSILLDVKKHKDITVLIATIDCAWVKITYSDSKILYQINLTIRNTSKQFIRIDIPQNADVWSTLVRHAAIKPAKDTEGKLMIPLEKSQANGDDTFSVELAYICPLESALSGTGQLSFTIPKMDIPISSLLVSAYLPLGFIYGEFDGPLKEVTQFSSSTPVAIAGPYPARRARQMQQQQQMPQMMMRNVAISNSNVYEDANESESSYEGLMPVRVQVPNAGKEFRFERLLVQDEKFEMTVPFKQLTKGYFQRRRLWSPNVRILGVALTFAAIIVAVALISRYVNR